MRSHGECVKPSRWSTRPIITNQQFFSFAYPPECQTKRQKSCRMHLVAQRSASILGDNHTETTVGGFARRLSDAHVCRQSSDDERSHSEIVQELIQFRGINWTTGRFVKNDFLRLREYSRRARCWKTARRQLRTRVGKEKATGSDPATFVESLPRQDSNSPTCGTSGQAITKWQRRLTLSITDDSDSIPHHE